jgi:hypothetical protein
MSTATNRKTIIQWDFTDDKRVQPSQAKPSKVWNILDTVAHAVCVNHETSKISGAGTIKDYFIIVCHPCCNQKLSEYSSLGFRMSSTYPKFLLEYSMTDADLRFFKEICTRDYRLVHSFPGKVYETKMESFKEVFQLSKEVILEWKKKQEEKINDAYQASSQKKTGRPRKSENTESIEKNGSN